MKTIVQIQTEPFQLISQEFDCEMTPDEAVEAYRALQRAYKGGDGLPEKDFNAFIDRYLLGDKNHVEEYQLMNKEQQNVCQIIKRSLKRIEARQNK